MTSYARRRLLATALSVAALVLAVAAVALALRFDSERTVDCRDGASAGRACAATPGRSGP